MIRKFYLENALGNQWQLTDKNFTYFLHEPTNLGFVKDISTITMGNVEKIVGERYQHINPTGELIFYASNSGNYQQYFDYIQFIRHQPIKLYYCPPNTFTKYYQEGTVAQTDKTETSADGVMRCPFYFKPTTHWLTSEYNQLALTSQMTGEGKTYPMSYPYHYAGNSLANISLNNDGSLPVGFILEINGTSTNAEWSVFDEFGSQYGKGKLIGTFDYIRIDSRDGNESIYLENGGSVIANPSSYQDLSIADGQSFVTFIKLKMGKSTMSLSLGAFTGDVRIQWRNAYVSV